MKDKTVKQWFEVAVQQPCDDAFRIQLGCHFEEVAEMLEELSVSDGNYIHDSILVDALESMMQLSAMLKNGSITLESLDRVALLDSICDQQVTGVGVAHMLGMDIDGAMDEVNKSNWSKFVDGNPVFNEQGKIAKGPYYKAPELERFV